MQVFLPERDFTAAAEVLDQKRLVKQLLEGRQILAALAGLSKGWTNHPASKMFRNHESTLYNYLESIANEMDIRGYKWQNNWEVIESTYHKHFKNSVDLGLPSWILDDRYDKIIHTHRANLYIKAPELYPQYHKFTETYRNLVCCDKCNYYWPTHKNEGI